MNPLMRYSTAIKGGGNPSNKTRLKRCGQYKKAVKTLRKNGLDRSQIKSIMREKEPIPEGELAIMVDLKCDLLEARSRIHSAIQYGLIEYKGWKPSWLK